MSALTPTVPAMSGGTNPWRTLRNLAHVTLRWHEGGPMGRTRHSDQTISLRSGMTWEERRCTVLHECLHIKNGPQPLGLRAKEEEQVRRDTARIMLPNIRNVADALAWAHSHAEAAEELGVDIYVLLYRLRHLHPAERHYLRARLEDDHGVG